MPAAATTSYGAPVHTTTGQTYGGMQIAKSPAAWSALNDQVNTYNDAARKWNAGAGPSVGNFINNMSPGGFQMEPPSFNRPSTYVGGDYHTSWNPGSLLGIAGAMVPGGGMLTGALGEKLYSGFGGQNAMIGGGQVPGNWGLNGGGGYPGGQMAQGGNTPSSQQNAQGRQNSAGDHLQQLAALNSNIAGNAGAPVNSGTAPAAQTPGLPSSMQYQQRMGRIQQITPGYGVSLPSYQYSGRATV